MNKKLIIGVVLVCALVGLTVFWGTRNGGTLKAPDGKPGVVASFYPYYFFATEIGGDKVTVTNITPAGAEPHDYEPTAQDIAKIEKSRLLILNGAGLEAWGTSIQRNIDRSRTNVIVAGDVLANKRILKGGKMITDPHIWLSPPIALAIVGKITDGLKTSDPKNTRYYEANADILRSKLRDLHVRYMENLSSCSQHTIITSHSAFGYLAAAYHFTQMPITGLSPDAEPSAQQLGVITDFARKNNVKYIFFESLASPKLAETLAHEVGAQTLVLNPLEGLSNDELAQGKNYFTEMENNLINLVIALQCTK